MITLAFAVAALGFAIFCVAKIIEGFRSGEMQLLCRGWSPYFFRKIEPVFFWIAVVFNVFLASVATVGGIALTIRWIDGR